MKLTPAHSTKGTILFHQHLHTIQDLTFAKQNQLLLVQYFWQMLCIKYSFNAKAVHKNVGEINHSLNFSLKLILFFYQFFLFSICLSLSVFLFLGQFQYLLLFFFKHLPHDLFFCFLHYIFPSFLLFSSFSQSSLAETFRSFVLHLFSSYFPSIPFCFSIFRAFAHLSTFFLIVLFLPSLSLFNLIISLSPSFLPFLSIFHLILPFFFFSFSLSLSLFPFSISLFAPPLIS